MKTLLPVFKEACLKYYFSKLRPDILSFEWEVFTDIGFNVITDRFIDFKSKDSPSYNQLIKCKNLYKVVYFDSGNLDTKCKDLNFLNDIRIFTPSRLNVPMFNNISGNQYYKTVLGYELVDCMCPLEFFEMLAKINPKLKQRIKKFIVINL